MAGFINLTREKQNYMVCEVEIGKIKLNPNRQEKQISESEILQLAATISKNGLLQPISVRKLGEKYELITGEKSFKAAIMCELQTVPCIVYEMSDRDIAIWALVEEIEKHDVSFFEEAEAIEKLISYYGLTQEEAASKLGKAQSTIANKLRILRLTKEERQIIVDYNLTERHARALLRLGSVQDRLTILDKISKNNLNVEKTEILIESFIGKRKEELSNKKKPIVFHSVTVFLNTVNKAIQAMQSAGVNAEARKIQSDEYIEYRVRIPMRSI